MKSIKDEVVNEILNLMDEHIDSCITAMQGHYTVAEIARDCILSLNANDLK